MYIQWVFNKGLFQAGSHDKLCFKSYLYAIIHRRRKGWGYGAAAPPDSNGAP